MNLLPGHLSRSHVGRVNYLLHIATESFFVTRQVPVCRLSIVPVHGMTEDSVLITGKVKYPDTDEIVYKSKREGQSISDLSRFNRI